MVNGMNDMNGGADMIRRFSRVLAGVGALALLATFSPARADESTSTWLGLATQTCVAQAPNSQPTYTMRRPALRNSFNSSTDL